MVNAVIRPAKSVAITPSRWRERCRTHLVLACTVYFGLAVVCYWHIWGSDITTISFPAGDQYSSI